MKQAVSAAVAALALLGGCALPETNFSTYPGFAQYFRDHPRRSEPAGVAGQALLEKHRPRLFLPPHHAGLVGFYEDYIAQGRLYDGAGQEQAHPVTQAALNQVRDDPRAVFVHQPDHSRKPTPVVFARIDHGGADLGRFGQRQFTFLTYHAVFRYSGLAAGIDAWKAALLSIAGNPDDWHQLDHYTAATLVLDNRGQAVALMLQQHNHLRTWIFGADLPSPAEGRPALDVAVRSNELYPHQAGRHSHRVVQFATPDAMLWLMEAGEVPRNSAHDITDPAAETDYTLAFLPPDDAFYAFAGFLGERRRLPGRDGPPGADYNTLPSIKPLPLQLLAGYWRPGHSGDLERLRATYARTGEPADFAHAQAKAFGESLARAR